MTVHAALACAYYFCVCLAPLLVAEAHRRARPDCNEVSHKHTHGDQSATYSYSSNTVTTLFIQVIQHCTYENLEEVCVVCNIHACLCTAL